MSNVLSEEKKQQVLALGRLGWSLRRIQQQTGIHRETAGEYLREAGIEVRPPGAWGRRSPAKPANEVTTDSGPKPANEVTTDLEPVPVPEPIPSASICEPFRDMIEVAVSAGRNAMSIWQDLVDKCGFTGSYQSAKRFVGKLRGPTQEACGVIITAPGEEAQVDYGSGPMVRHPQTGKYRRTRLFVCTLGYSRKCVRLLVWKSSTQVWAELHERAFQRLGGATQVVVLDNLREGILKPDIWDPTVNPLYRDVLKHYGAVALACRVRDPDRKGKVESGVGHAKRTPLKGQRFESLEAAQAHLDHWEERWADTRIHGTTKRQVAAMFAEEKPALLPLPIEPFRYYQFGDRTVNLDGCVEVGAAYYSTPPGWIGRLVPVQWDALHVRILHPDTGQLMREHLIQKRGGHRIPEEDRHQHAPLSTHRLLARAAKAGPCIGTLCRAIYDRDGQPGIRRMQGVLALAKKHGVAVTEEACAVALEVEVPTYQFVRKYLARGPQLPLTLRQVDPLIRDLTTYRDLIDQRTKENNPDESD